MAHDSGLDDATLAGGYPGDEDEPRIVDPVELLSALERIADTSISDYGQGFGGAVEYEAAIRQIAREAIAKATAP